MTEPTVEYSTGSVTVARTLQLPQRSGPEVDRLYAELIAAQADLDDEAAADWLARLALILCQHIGDAEVLRQAFALARDPSMVPLARDPAAVPPAQVPHGNARHD